MVFSSNRITPAVSFAAALRGSAEQQQQPQANQVPVISTRSRDKTYADPNTAARNRSVSSGSKCSQTLDNMLIVVTVVQQIMTDFNGAVSEEDKIVAITKIVLNLMKLNGH
jgi:hypothetical protein